MSDLTLLLDRTGNGERAASEELLPLVYDELRKLAAARLAQESAGQTLQPTALVHEAWLRLIGDDDTCWNSRGHFFGAAAEAMRRILVDIARRKQSVRHGGDQQRMPWTGLDLSATDRSETILAVSEALESLAAEDPVCADLVKLRFFAGFSNTEAAQMLGMSERTAKRTWAYARARLYEELKNQG